MEKVVVFNIPLTPTLPIVIFQILDSTKLLVFGLDADLMSALIFSRIPALHFYLEMLPVGKATTLILDCE